MNRNQVHSGKLTKVRKRRFLAMIALAALAIAPVFAQSNTTGSFTLVGSTKQSRRLHTATLLLNGKVLVAGGAPLLPAATSEIYDPFTATWTNSGSLNTGRQFHTATLLQDGRAMVTGGETAIELLASTELYDPAIGQWTNAGVLNTGR